jgi:hydroxymethylglutaryl-CoA synthase
MTISVISYGVYIPFLRIKREEYISALGSCSAAFKEKAVMDIDEDTITMAVEAARDAVAGVDKSRIGVLALASTNFPYREKVAAGTVIEALGLSNNILTCQHGNSTLAGTEAILSAAGLLGLTDQKYALVVVSDAPASGASVDMEHGFGAAACAFVLAKDEPGLEFEGVYAYAAESMGLRYGLPGETDLRDIGVKTYSNLAYNDTLRASVRGLLDKLGRKPGDYRHVILHQYDAKTASGLAKKLGFGEEQINAGLVFAQLGDTGACSTLVGLCNVLDNASPGDNMIICSYGSGAGSHALSFKLTGQPPKPRNSLKSLLERKKYIGYVQYLKLKRNI